MYFVLGGTAPNNILSFLSGPLLELFECPWCREKKRAKKINSLNVDLNSILLVFCFCAFILLYADYTFSSGLEFVQEQLFIFTTI